MKQVHLLMITGLLVLAGCASTLESGGRRHNPLSGATVYLAPLRNATDDDHAAIAITELTGTMLMSRGITVINAEASTDSALPDSKELASQARSKGAAFLVEGTVHEYRYKTDLDGDPAVGITLRLVSASNGKVVWQGTGSEVGVGFSSLTSAAQETVQELVDRMTQMDSATSSKK